MMKSYILNPSLPSSAHPFIISSRASLTFSNFSALVNSALGGLERTFQPGERVAILSGNCPEYLILLFAMWQLKVVPILINTRWPESYISDNLRKINCRQIICASDFFSLNLRGIKKERLDNIVSFSPKNLPPFSPKPIHLYLNQDGSTIFTSGSSGKPKAILHTLGNHYFNALGSNQNIQLQPGDRWLLSLPLYHVGGLSIVFRTLLAGSAMVIPDLELSLEKSISNQKITHLSLVATQLYRLLQKQRIIPHLKNMKSILLGGGPVPFSLLKKCAEIKLPIYVSYGSTEMASQITTTSKSDGLEQWKTSGKLLPYRELRLLGNGEILVRGKTLCKGYLSSGKLKKITDKAGWFHSGDLGELSEDGYLTVMGRKDNLFISGGEKIQPEEIEEQIRNIPGVEEVVVVQIPDLEFGERPVAVIKMEENKKKEKRQDSINKKTKQGWQRTETIEKFREIEDCLRKLLPRYKVPDHFLLWPEEGRKGLKINRVEFRKWAEKMVTEGRLAKSPSRKSP